MQANGAVDHGAFLLRIVPMHIKAKQFRANTLVTRLHCRNKRVLPKIGVPQNGWFMTDNPIKMDVLRVPLFLETPEF